MNIFRCIHIYIPIYMFILTDNDDDKIDANSEILQGGRIILLSSNKYQKM
jgi:hypothetical protein